MSYTYSSAPPQPGGYPGQPPIYGNAAPPGMRSPPGPPPAGVPNGVPGAGPYSQPYNPPKTGPTPNGPQGNFGPPASNGFAPLSNQIGDLHISGPTKQDMHSTRPPYSGPTPGQQLTFAPNQPPPTGPPSSSGPSSHSGQYPTGPPPTFPGATPSQMRPPLSGANAMPPPPSRSRPNSQPQFGQPPPHGPPTSYGAAPPSGPPTFYGTAPPNAPPTGQAPPTSVGAPPPMSSPYIAPAMSSAAPPLGAPSSMGGPAPSSYGAPPSSVSQNNMPYGAPPMWSGCSAPPGSAPYGPPSTSGQYGAPPSVNTSYGSMPPGSGPMPPPPMGGATGMPPPLTNMPRGPGAPGMPPPPPGGQPPPSPGGQYGNYGGPLAPSPQQPMAQPPVKRLDPDQMPSPIQVIEDNRRDRSGEFHTERGGMPPLVTTDFTVTDMGHASPRYLRSTLYNIPYAGDMLKTSHLPLAMTVTPFAILGPGEQEPPIVDLGQLGPIRCNRCKAYMCPNMQFIDGGRRFQCPFCNCATEVPPEYFQHLDHTGRRVDVYQRPELRLGTYEFVATADYCKQSKLPQAPAFIFMIDVSYNSVKSGLVQLMCDRLRTEVLPNLPKEAGASESEIRVGFVTYHRELHFYNIKGSLTQPQMMVVSDIEDVFVPIVDGFLVKLSESEAVIDSLLSQIPGLFADVRETEIVLGPVVQAGLDALQSAERAGKLLIFHASLPVAEAPGKLKNRDDRKLLGTDKEKTILTPQTPFYTKLAQQCVAAGCSVDLFLFPNSYIDVATVGELPRLTGGTLFKYQYFQADIDGDRFLEDLKLHVSKPIAFDAILRLRTCTGIRPVDFYGNFYMSNTTDVELAAISSDQAVTVEIKHDDKLSESEGACVQCAVLYTSVSGQRRLRVINHAFNVCSKMADLFRSCELDTVTNYMAKNALRQTLNGNPKQVREWLITSCSHMLACYRQQCASPSSAGQLILPEGMKLLPVYVNCIIKSALLQGAGDQATDERSALMLLGNALPIHESQVFFYPRLIPMRNSVGDDELPMAIRCSYERLEDRGVYLIENGMNMILWIGLNVSPDWVQKVFGVHSAAQIDIDMTHLQDLDNDMSRQVRRIIATVRRQRQRHMKLVIVRQRDKLEPLFLQFLVEDRSSNGTASYVDFLCHVHKEIRNLLS